MADHFQVKGLCQSQFTQIAAEKAKEAAEEYFKMGNIDKAIKQGFAALDLNPELRMVEKYITAYMIHKLGSMLSVCKKKRIMDETKILCAILCIQDCSSADAATIKKRYKEMVLLVHPDKNDSAAAEGAFKIVQEVWENLRQNKRRREA